MKGEWEREEAFKPLLERILGQKITNLALEAHEGIFRTRLTILSPSKVNDSCSMHVARLYGGC